MVHLRKIQNFGKYLKSEKGSKSFKITFFFLKNHRVKNSIIKNKITKIFKNGQIPVHNDMRGCLGFFFPTNLIFYTTNSLKG